MPTSTPFALAALALCLASTTACLDPEAGDELTGTIEPSLDEKADGVVSLVYRYTEVQGTGTAFAGTSKVFSPRPGTVEVSGPMLVLTPGQATGIHAGLKDGKDAQRFLLFTRPVGEKKWRQIDVAHEGRTFKLFTAAFIETPATALTVRIDDTLVTSAQVYPWAGSAQAWEYGLFVVPLGAFGTRVEERAWSFAFECGFGWDC